MLQARALRFGLGGQSYFLNDGKAGNFVKRKSSVFPSPAVRAARGFFGVDKGMGERAPKAELTTKWECDPRPTPPDGNRSLMAADPTSKTILDSTRLVTRGSLMRTATFT